MLDVRQSFVVVKKQFSRQMRRCFFRTAFHRRSDLMLDSLRDL
jgi:hypothetical protein